jgi:hypothetical protein
VGRGQGGPSTADGGCDFFKNAFDVAEYFVIPEAKDSISL